MTYRYEEERVETHEFTQSRDQKLHVNGRRVSSHCNAEFTNTFGGQGSRFATHEMPFELCYTLLCTSKWGEIS